MNDEPKVAFAIGAHPDDIEFAMAGTLLKLKDAGYEIHMMNLANGCCGTSHLSKEEIVRIRAAEASAAAHLAGATYHDSLCDDLLVFYEREPLLKLSAIVRDVRPSVILTHSPEDYMEDHSNTARLVVAAAFARTCKNVPTLPAHDRVDGPVAVYHAQPHLNHGPLRGFIEPEFTIDVGEVMGRKLDMLACHQSQRQWLDETQGMNSYIETMREMGQYLANRAGLEGYVEGWRKRSSLGFAPESFNPLQTVLETVKFSPDKSCVS